jgi:hypothetical protein
MKKQLVTILLALLVGVLGFAVSGVAVAAVSQKPPSPPGQGECEHGNALKPCKDDPQPDNGKDCEAHGNNGGVNEDHCKGDETTQTETTPTETTPTETTPTETTPTETTPTETTPSDGPPQRTTTETDSNTATNPASATSQASGPEVSEANTTQPKPGSGDDSSQPAANFVGTPPVAAASDKHVAVLSAAAPKPTRKAQQAPLTL